MILTPRDRPWAASGRKQGAGRSGGDAGHLQGLLTPSDASQGRQNLRLFRSFGPRRPTRALPRIAAHQAPRAVSDHIEPRCCSGLSPAARREPKRDAGASREARNDAAGRPRATLAGRALLAGRRVARPRICLSMSIVPNVIPWPNVRPKSLRQRGSIWSETALGAGAARPPR